jgi:hypothetical protein
MAADMPTEGDPEQLRREISRYPTDLGLCLRLGAALSRRGDYAGAIPELQKAMVSPHARLQAMRLLVEAYQGNGDLEQAVRMRERLSRESGEDDGSGSAPSPVPSRPRPPRDSSSGKQRPHEDDAV